MTMTYETVLFSQTDNIAVATVNRPDQLNALNEQVHTDLYSVAKRVTESDDIDVFILTGAGRAFVAGADIKAMIDYDADQAQAFSEHGHRTMDAIAAIPVPVIGALNGFALGGGLELALACDILYASEKAKLGLPEVSLGVIPGWGGTQRLARLIGLHAARELIFTGEMIRADAAKEIGLVRDVFPLDGFMDAVQAIAKTIASRGPLATRAAKKALATGLDLPLAEGLTAEQSAFGGLFGTDDQKEGMAAFIEGRAPSFTRK